MKNVIIHKVVQYVFTESQMKGLWQRLKEGTPYEDLSDEDIMGLAKRILEDASHSELEEFTLESPWRVSSDVEGKLLSQDDSDPSMHIELIDTSDQNKRTNDMVIDRMKKLSCADCGFIFYIEDLDKDTSNLKCPECGGKVKEEIPAVKTVKRDD